MDPNNKKDQKNNQNRNRNMRGVVTLIIWALVLTVVFNYINAYSNNLTKRASSHEIPYSQLIDLIQEDQVAELKIENGVLYATPVDGYVYTEEATDKNKEPKSYTQSEKTPLILYTTALNDASLLPLLEEHNVKYTSPVQTQMSPILEFMITYVLPVIVLAALLMLLLRMLAKSGGSGFGGIGSVGKSNAKVYMEKSTGVTFKDVAGQDEAKESLEEIIDFLHNPQKYTAIGARLPKGALLVGSPGTGKTLLAKAVAGEANVPFFSISGSDFVEMFVGVGASRVRDLFKEAAKVAPCIIFIDEIDTIGKSRDGGRFGGGNDEREQTLNQLLAELDGFDPGKGIIVLGATNRPEVLDKALLRPGRFDRRITVDRPNLAGRLATLQVHTRSIHLAEDVNLEKIAQATAGCVGADLANLVNEAALRAVRLGRSAVNQNDLLAAFETVIAGSEKKGTVITDEEKRIIAYHEVGHALVAAKQKNAQPVSKITIVPHTQGALGYTLHLPEEEKFLMSREDILAEIRTLLAGRSSEEVVCHTMTSGAANDIERATEMARNLVARFGMCEEFDMMALGSVQNQYLDGTYSMSCAQETYAAADRAVIAIIRQCHEDARRMLEENRELLDKIAAYLLKKETITGQEMMAIIEGRDPETVDNYGATREEKQPLFRPSSPEVIEAPAKHIHIVSEPVPSPEEPQIPEEPQTPEEKSPEEAQPDRDPEESEQK